MGSVGPRDYAFRQTRDCMRAGSADANTPRAVLPSLRSGMMITIS